MLYPDAEVPEAGSAREHLLVGVEEYRDAPVPDNMEGALPPPPSQELELGERRGRIRAEFFVGGIRERLGETGIARGEGPVQEVLDGTLAYPIGVADS